jgi:hypothetical protein
MALPCRLLSLCFDLSGILALFYLIFLIIFLALEVLTLKVFLEYAEGVRRLIKSLLAYRVRLYEYG